jgi:hypothetical protein
MQSIERPKKEKTIGGFNPAHLSESRGFDGKRVRKAIQRRTVDYNSVLIRHLEVRIGSPFDLVSRYLLVGS